MEGLRYLLCSEDRDFLITNIGNKVKVDELEGKYVGLYFSAHWCPPCKAFTSLLAEVYTNLLEKERDFEIIFVSGDVDEKSFEKYHHVMPWPALPFSDVNAKEKLLKAFHVTGIPALVVLDKEGKILTSEGVDIIRKYGVEGYPFSAEKLDRLRAKEEAVRDAQTVETLLVSDERDFVISHGEKVQVSDLVGKTIALYFSANWCSPCQAFTPKLIQVYNELKEKGESFEIVFISNDEDQGAFEEYFSIMPWLALPFRDKIEKDLSRRLHTEGIPTLIVIGPDGKTVTDDAISAVSVFGAKAYPFTTLQIEKLQKEIEDLAGKSAKEVDCSQHEHPLVLTRKHEFNCDECDEEGSQWSYYCDKCDFDLHLTCALKDQQWLGSNSKRQNEEGTANDNCKPGGVICDGDSCYRG